MVLVVGAADQLDRDGRPSAAEPARAPRRPGCRRRSRARRTRSPASTRSDGADRADAVEDADRRRAVGDRRGEQHVDVVEDPVGLRRRPSRSARSAQSTHPRRHPGAQPVGLAGAPLQPVVVLDLVGLGADAGEELRHERARRVGVARVDLATSWPRSASSRAVSWTAATWTGSGRTPERDRLGASSRSAAGRARGWRRRRTTRSPRRGRGRRRRCRGSTS